MAFITDSLRSAIEGIGRRIGWGNGRMSTGLTGIFSHQLAIAAYMSSGMMRKAIAIPAADRTQKWRDWQTDKETIKKIEAEEKRLGLRAKTKQAEILRGCGGGAMILVTAGDHSQPLDPKSIGKGGLVAINVVSRWEIQGKDYVRDVASPQFRQPRMFSINSETGSQDIHPSRVVCFRGDPLPHGAAVSDEETFWGDSRLLRVFREVERSDEAQAWFLELVRKAKLLRVGIPDLLDMMATDEGKQQLDARIALIAEGENTLNATVFRSGTGNEDPGEKIDDYQINFTGIPAMGDMFDQRVACVSDIPFTKLMGRSPAGMNATGEHDLDNWHDAVGDGQENETRPCLEAIDPLLLRSAGVSKPEDVWWLWSALRKPTDKEKAETFKLLTEAVNNLMLAGLIPEKALQQAVINLIEEHGYLPGLAEAVAKLSQAERDAPFEEDDDTDPSDIVPTEGGDPASAGKRGGKPPASRAANDAKPRTLYVKRMLLPEDARKFIAWAKAQGFKSTVPADSLHVTVFSSTNAVDWIKAGTDWNEDESGEMFVPAGGARIVEPLGDNGAAVLLFNSSRLAWRHESIARDTGAQDRFPDYQPHLTIVYEGAGDMDLSKVEPYRGALRFGPEIFEEAVEGWRPEEA